MIRDLGLLKGVASPNLHGAALDLQADGMIRKNGSAQEFDGTRILGCFPENDEFGSGCGHALGFEQQVAEVLIPAAAA